MTLFLVIQHSNLSTQEKYLPMLRDAVKQRKAEGANLALLEDRVAIRRGERQIYGSQVNYDMETHKYYLLPLEDPENVNRRRNSVGLGQLEDYLSRWGIKWSAESYEERWPTKKLRTFQSVPFKKKPDRALPILSKMNAK